MRAVETLTLVLAAVVLFMWVILAHPTPDEQTRVYDSMGQEHGRCVAITRIGSAASVV